VGVQLVVCWRLRYPFFLFLALCGAGAAFCRDTPSHPSSRLPFYLSTLISLDYDHTLSRVPILRGFRLHYLYDLLRTDDHPYSILHVAFALRLAYIFLLALSFVLVIDILSSLQSNTPCRFLAWDLVFP
jgi:hypothetical protein